MDTYIYMYRYIIITYINNVIIMGFLMALKAMENLENNLFSAFLTYNVAKPDT